MKIAVLLNIFLLILSSNNRIMAQDIKTEQPTNNDIHKTNIPEKAEDISPLLIGEKIPNILITDKEGNPFNLKEAVSKKPTILVFYRGGWCPYCNVQLSALQEIIPEIKALDYQIIAISTDSPKNLNETSKQKKLEYILLSDSDLSLAKAFGIAFEAPKKYESMLSNSSEGKNAKHILPVPSVFIVDKESTIQFEYISPDYTHRLNANLLLKIIEEIKLDK